MTDPGTLSAKSMSTPLKLALLWEYVKEQRTRRQKREPSGTPIDFQQMGVVKIIP